MLWLGGMFVLDKSLSLELYQRLFCMLNAYSIHYVRFAEVYHAPQKPGFTAVIERINDIMDKPIEIRDLESNKQRTFNSGNTKANGKLTE
jgi:hypothetical protein